ncbi:MAG TPA: hypothetical protein VFA60_06920 [Terriglobales bacterium]|nr:hypothetical protein [Terriglobales bacterium]
MTYIDHDRAAAPDPLKRGVRIAVLLALLGAAIYLSLPAHFSGQPFPDLAANLDPLAAEFNRNAGKVRVVLITDPT